MQLKLVIRHAHSLKDKRSAIKGVKERIRNKFNASVAEVDAQDMRQMAILGVVVVGTDGKYVSSVLNKIVNLLKPLHQVELVDYEIEIF